MTACLLTLFVRLVRACSGVRLWDGESKTEHVGGGETLALLTLAANAKQAFIDSKSRIHNDRRRCL